MHLLVPFLVRPAVVAFIVAVTLSGSTTPVPAAGPRLPPAVHRTGATTVTGTDHVAPTTSATGGSSRGGRARTFTWPLSPQPGVHRRFELPRDQYSRGHRGVDLLAAVGQPVLSVGEGVVAFSGVIAGRGVVTIRHADGLRTSYEPVDARLTSGSVVHRGDKIGVLSRAAGHCVPLTCLHWGAISGQTYRDPLSLVSFGRPILLPLG
jgi:murein DD-endopeptidase MepM/ murein hydrolase activator NlpD